MTLLDRIEALVVSELRVKTFSTNSIGSTGYHATFKVDDSGHRYEVSCTAVLVGSRPEKPPNEQ